MLCHIVDWSRWKAKVIVFYVRINAQSVSGNGPEFVGRLTASLKRYCFKLIKTRDVDCCEPNKKPPTFFFLSSHYTHSQWIRGYNTHKQTSYITYVNVDGSIVYLKYWFRELLKYCFKFDTEEREKMHSNFSVCVCQCTVQPAYRSPLRVNDTDAYNSNDTFLNTAVQQWPFEPTL